MGLPTGLLLAALAFSPSFASPSENAPLVAYETANIKVTPASTSAFKVKIGPKPPFKPMPVSTPRTKDCLVKKSASDDSAAILEAIKACNNGGRVIFDKDSTYNIGKALDLTKLNKIDLVINGNIKFTGEASYWAKNAFKHGFQDGMSFFQLGGTDVNVYGGGTIDGNGSNYKGKRIILFAVVGLKGGVISNISLKKSPQWFNLIKDSQDVVYDNIRIDGKSKNTDGWDTLHSTNIVIQNAIVNNGDDCVSFKPGSIGIVVQNVKCTGSHGMSVGSLGQYKGKVDIVENVLVYNISMTSSTYGARIKTWAGKGYMNGVGNGGGGSGRVGNIVFEKFKINSVGVAIFVTQCYGTKDPAVCAKDPSKISISNVKFRDFTGTVSGKKKKAGAGQLLCSTPSSCKNIEVTGFKVSGGLTCRNVKVAGTTCSKD